MKRKWLTIGFLASLSAMVAGNMVAGNAIAQQDRQGSQSSSSSRSSSSESQNDDQTRSNSSRSQNSYDERGSSSSGSNFDEEYRLRYNDDQNRLSIDVDEDIRFRDDQARRNWARDGEFDLRYDSDRNDVRAAGEGTIDVDRAAGALSQWWQSWWEDERQARRSRQEGSARGTYEFVRQHDSNNDGYLSRQEVPERYRKDFATVDRNDDGYLSQTEFRQYGDYLFDSRRGSSNQSYASRSSQPNQNDQTWSEWWSSWWSDNDQSTGSIEAGAQQFVRQHDRNNDGYLSRRELPQRMQDEFYRVDSNGDEFLSRSEIQRRGSLLRDSSESNRSSTAQSSAQRGNDQRSSSANQNDQTWSQWWASWWSNDSSGNIEAGAQQFVRQHDRNDDGYLTRRELPQRMQSEFDRVDTNGDDYLSRAEVRQRGSMLRGSSSVSRSNDSRSQANQDDQTWSQWWASWWSDDSSGGQLTADSGAKQFIERHDQNNDGYLVRSEMPQRMYDEFARIDTNNDRYLSRGEIARRVDQSRLDQRNVTSNQRNDGQSSARHASVAVVYLCDECFARLDRDDDRELSRSEARDSVFAERFNEFDGNGDGYLTKNEIRRSVEQQNESQRASNDSDYNNRDSDSRR